MSGKLRRAGEIQKMDSTQLAEYILAKMGPMNHLKLQKLLYYVQAYHLAYFNQALIDDEFEAWVHGPVSRKVWNEFREASRIYEDVYFEDQAYPQQVVDETEAQLSQEQLDLIADVLEEYGILSGYRLECLTHSEQPWKEARKGLAPAECSNNVIAKDAMRHFYKQMLYPG